MYSVNLESCFFILVSLLLHDIAKKEKKSVNYNSELNKLALLLPEDLVKNFSQGVIWLWKNNK